jgi:hypothetical protein
MTSDASALLEAYAWAQAPDPDAEALSLTLVSPADGSALQRLAPRRQLPGLLTVARALDAGLGIDDYAWGAVLGQPDRLGDWDVIIEPNGWAASMPETLEALSTGGTAVNAFWNVNAVVTFGLARAGSLVRSFDALLYDNPATPLAEEVGLPWGVGSPRASLLALVERLTGVRIDRGWLLETPRPTFEIPL